MTLKIGFPQKKSLFLHQELVRDFSGFRSHRLHRGAHWVTRDMLKLRFWGNHRGKPHQTRGRSTRQCRQPHARSRQLRKSPHLHKSRTSQRINHLEKKGFQRQTEILCDSWVLFDYQRTFHLIMTGFSLDYQKTFFAGLSRFFRGAVEIFPRSCRHCRVSLRCSIERQISETFFLTPQAFQRSF